MGKSEKHFLGVYIADHELVQALKHAAVDQRTTISELVERAIRLYLSANSLQLDMESKIGY